MTFVLILDVITTIFAACTTMMLIRMKTAFLINFLFEKDYLISLYPLRKKHTHTHTLTHLTLTSVALKVRPALREKAVPELRLEGTVLDLGTPDRPHLPAQVSHHALVSQVHRAAMQRAARGAATHGWGTAGRRGWREAAGTEVQYRSLEETGTAVRWPGGSGGCSWLWACRQAPPCWRSSSALVLSSSAFFAELAVADASASVEDAGSGSPSASGPASVR